MLGGSEFRLRQGFAYAKRLYAALAAGIFFATFFKKKDAQKGVFLFTGKLKAKWNPGQLHSVLFSIQATKPMYSPPLNSAI